MSTTERQSKRVSWIIRFVAGEILQLGIAQVWIPRTWVRVREFPELFGHIRVRVELFGHIRVRVELQCTIPDS